MLKLELEKINLEHQNNIEKIKVVNSNQLTYNVANTLLTSLLSNPQGIKDVIELGKKLKDEK